MEAEVNSEIAYHTNEWAVSSKQSAVSRRWGCETLEFGIEQADNVKR